MQYGICNLGVVPLRSEPRDASEQVSQVLYGELFKVLEQRKKWSRIRLAFDKYEGWIDNKQYVEIEEEQYNKLVSDQQELSADLIDFVSDHNKQLLPIPMGSCLHTYSSFDHEFEGNSISGGEALSFIEESEPGDLAFFDNDEGIITHVGIIMKDNYIIHAHGKVRIDRIDHTGIFNLDSKKHSHKLRVIKKII